MELLYPVAAGIDVHRDTVVVSIRRRDEREREKVTTRTFETYHDTLEQMVQWLDENEVPIVGLESTGVYWKPVVRLLQLRSPQRVVWLVNPAMVKKVPGRKTDVKDSEWLSKLVMHGLVSPSFLPSAELDELRKLTRFRTTLVAEQTRSKNRIVKELEASGLKLATVCTDPLGVTGRAILHALLSGQQLPEQLAELARGTLRQKMPLLKRAVQGSLSASTAIVLRMLLERIEQVERDLATLDAQIQTLLMPYQREVARMATVPGLDQVTIAAILAEIGPDMSVFGAADRLAAWGGVSPGSNESAGKSKATPARKGDKYLRTALVQASWAATRSRQGPWKQAFGRLVVRMERKKALVAIARKMLVAIFHMLRDDVPYQPAPPPPVPPARRQRQIQRHLEALQALGVNVTMTPASPATTDPEPSRPVEGTFS